MSTFAKTLMGGGDVYIGKLFYSFLSVFLSHDTLCNSIYVNLLSLLYNDN